VPRQAAIARRGRICCSGNFCAESIRSNSDWPCLRRKAGGRQVTRARVPLSDHLKTPAQSPAHATIRRMEKGSRKATHEALDLSVVGHLALGLKTSKQVRQVRFPRSAPTYFLPTVPPGVGTGLLIRTRCVRAAGRQPTPVPSSSGKTCRCLRQVGSSILPGTARTGAGWYRRGAGATYALSTWGHPPFHTSRDRSHLG
jgi:hypothetical protein